MYILLLLYGIVDILNIGKVIKWSNMALLEALQVKIDILRGKNEFYLCMDL